jgi:hypothetical protein
MDLQLSEETSLLALGLNAALNQHLLKLQTHLPKDEFDAVRLRFGYAMAGLLDIVNPIYKEHPSLLPVQMDGTYVVSDDVFHRYFNIGTN